MAPFRFLDLPAELRNHIYDLAIHSSQSCRLKNPIYRPVEAYSDSRYEGFFGLTQTSRQVRNEFRPLYMDLFTVSIDIRDVETFSEGFIVVYAFRDPQAASKSIEFILDEELCVWPSCGLSFDITPLFQTAAPITFSGEGLASDWTASMMNDELLGNWAVWRDALNGELNQVLFRIGDRAFVDLVMRKPCRLAWVHEWDARLLKEHWARRAGVQYLVDHGVSNSYNDGCVEYCFSLQE